MQFGEDFNPRHLRALWAGDFNIFLAYLVPSAITVSGSGPACTHLIRQSCWLQHNALNVNVQLPVLYTYPGQNRLALIYKHIMARRKTFWASMWFQNIYSSEQACLFLYEQAEPDVLAWECKSWTMDTVFRKPSFDLVITSSDQIGENVPLYPVSILLLF